MDIEGVADRARASHRLVALIYTHRVPGTACAHPWLSAEGVFVVVKCSVCVRECEAGSTGTVARRQLMADEELVSKCSSSPATCLG